MTTTRPQDPTPPAEPVGKEPRARHRSKWRRLLTGAAVGGALAAVGPAADAADRVPLIAPRPAARVRIAPPKADAAAKLRAAATFFEPAPAAEAKPEITAGPAALSSPTGPSAPLRLLPTRIGKPLTALAPAGLIDPAGPREAGRLSPVRRIERVPASDRLSVPAVSGDGYQGDEGVVTVADREKEDADDLAGPDTPADAADLDEPAVEPEPPAPLDPLAVACDEAIRVTAARLLTGEARGTATNTPWQIGHGLIGPAGGLHPHRRRPPGAGPGLAGGRPDVQGGAVVRARPARPEGPPVQRGDVRLRGAPQPDPRLPGDERRADLLHPAGRERPAVHGRRLDSHRPAGGPPEPP